MPSRQERKIMQEAQALLGPGEEVLAAFVARPRGWQQRNAGSIHLGARQVGKALEAGERAGLPLASPMALAVTPRRLLTLKIGAALGFGVGGGVKELVGSLPLEAVDSIRVKRLALGKVVSIHAGGEEIKLEANAVAGAKALVDAFERAKAPVAA